MTNRECAELWIKRHGESVHGVTALNTLTALFDTIDAEATRRSAEIVRDLAANLHEGRDPSLAAVIRKALGHAAKKIEEASGR